MRMGQRPSVPKTKGKSPKIEDAAQAKGIKKSASEASTTSRSDANLPSREPMTHREENGSQKKLKREAALMYQLEDLHLVLPSKALGDDSTRTLPTEKLDDSQPNQPSACSVSSVQFTFLQKNSSNNNVKLDQQSGFPYHGLSTIRSYRDLFEVSIRNSLCDSKIHFPSVRL
jgi:hypothetical protein